MSKQKEKEAEENTQSTTGGSKSYWVDVKNEEINFDWMKEHQNKIVLDLNDRYFNFNEDFDGIEKDFNTSNVIWIKWWSKIAPKTSQENWKKNKIEYSSDIVEISANAIAEALTEFGDVSIVKDSSISAYIEFASFDPNEFKRGISKENIFKNSVVLKKIQKKLENWVLYPLILTE